ncbi:MULTISPECIES: protein NnrT [unclassified Phaeobacter]|uniref:protein NnrT n=1 Tax=unclassified Phaeobacter TaxID=2621772 RepID=UPI003A8A6681
MRRILFILSCAATVASPAIAKGFDRPVPQAQSATAEFWFALACIALVMALAAVHMLVMRR